MDRPAPLYDLTHPLSPQTPVYPGDRPVGVRLVASLESEGYRARRLDLGTHSGTHVDAPAHLMPEGTTLDRLPLDLWVGPAVLVERGELGAAAHLPPRVLVRGVGEGGLTPDEARLLVEAGVGLVGVDGPSVDPVGAAELPAHRILLGAGLAVVENLRLQGAPAGPGTLYCLPLAVAGGDGAPVRALWRPEGT
ncbi:cyclase family protein [Deferrisoma camini]|uniref:cyclase family protein n=1 Tax=Deferrisoma camini TaxID=1035120 RepID=UPI00046D42FD|nr:cyclase family protein [Deferrisoma camini]